MARVGPRYPFALGTMALAAGVLYLVFKRRDWL